MEDLRVGTEARTDFPPWSVKVLLIWAAGFLVMSAVLGALSSLALVHLNAIANLRLSGEQVTFIATLVGQVLFLSTVFGFLLRQLLKTPFTFADLWGPQGVQPRQVSIAVFLGIALVLAPLLIVWKATGEPGVTHIRHAPLEWRVALAMEFLVNVIMVSFVEEIFHRALIYQALRKLVFAGGAVLLSAIAFAACHPGAWISTSRMIFVFVFGVIAAVLLETSGSLWTCICFHVSTNATARILSYMDYILPLGNHSN